MKHRTGTALLLFLTSSAWANDSLVSIGDPKYLTGNLTGGKITYLKYPTLGCPSIAKAGSSGTAWVKLADGGTTTAFNLSIVPNGDAVGATYALPVTGVAFDAATSIYKVTYSVATDIPEDMYDLKLSIPGQAVTDIQYNSFKVVKQETSAYTFLVISDSHFNDPRGWWSPANYNAGNYNAATIVEQLKKEVRALNPTFVILTGDTVFGLDYDYEYEGAWNVWKNAGFPIFMVPGNHDGYACIQDRTFLGIGSPKRDGLDHWRKYFGPNYYSFQFGGTHFQAVNSYDGTPERRDGFLIVIENFGGDLLPAQQDWIAADLAGLSAPVVPFMHHNPMGGYRDNQPFGMFQWVLNRIWEWITDGNLDDFSQTWNTKATGEFLLNQYAAVGVAFVGHHHADTIKVHNATTYRVVTSSGTDSGDYWGYAFVKVQDSKVADHLYLDADKYMSIPTGNLHIRPGETDGPVQSAKVESGLAKSYDVTIEFVMPSAPAYEATNGTVVQFAPVDAATSKVWVRAQTLVADDIKQPKTVEVSVTTAAAPVVAGATETPPTGSAGGSCGAPNAPGHASGHLLLTLLPLSILLLQRRLKRKEG